MVCACNKLVPSFFLPSLLINLPQDGMIDFGFVIAAFVPLVLYWM
jgi:hypothetical protein